MDSDFAFAFNNSKFSDRLLRIEITGDDGEVACSSIADWDRDRKRRRLDSNTQSHGPEESSSKPIATPLVLKVKELHISSPILAAKSPFFYKAFSTGKLESEKRLVTLNIHASEEVAVMELLNFIYTNSLSVSVTTAPALLDVLMAADKFEVASCIKYCTRLLLSMPMTVDFALLLLDLPSSMVATDSVKPLINAARQFLASHFKNLNKFPVEEVVALPLQGIEVILATDDLEISSEDCLYDIVLKWAKTHYSDIEERQEVLGSRLAHYIRFSHLTCTKLEKILSSDDFRPCVASSLVLEALFVKAESVRCQRSLVATERAYKYRPIKIVKFEAPRHQCIVYLDLTRKECAGLNPYGRVCFQPFHFGGYGFVLYAHCNVDPTTSFRCFGLFLRVVGKGHVSLTVDYEFAARTKPTEEFLGKGKGKYEYTEDNSVGYRNLFLVPWESFIATDSPYFIDDVLHLRADLSIRL